jgi:Actin like proteins N terminal domain
MKVKLILAVDLGSSLIKVFYWLMFEDGRVLEGLLTFCSAVGRITASRYETRRSVDDNTCVVVFDDNYWMVGDAAQEEVSVTNARAPKLRDAIAKVLAVLGQVLSRCVGDGEIEELHLDLGVLLPLDEMRSDQQLSERLRDLLCRDGFGHNGKTIKCDLLKGVHVSPEGYGVSRILKRYPSTVLVFGHRDMACLHVNDESVSIPKSLPLPGWGMIKFINTVNYAFKDELAAAEAIFKAGEACKEKPLLKIVPPEDLAYVQGEIQEARSLVWAQIWDKLMDSTIQGAEQVLAVGGSAAYWRPELKKALGSRLSMGGEIIKDIQQRFPHLDNLSLLYRCSDCFMFWLTLLDASDLKLRSTELSVVVGGRKIA